MRSRELGCLHHTAASLGATRSESWHASIGSWIEWQRLRRSLNWYRPRHRGSSEESATQRSVKREWTADSKCQVYKGCSSIVCQEQPYQSELRVQQQNTS